MDLDKGFESYLVAKQNDVRPNAMTFANLLSLTAGFGEQGNTDQFITFQAICSLIHHTQANISFNNLHRRFLILDITDMDYVRFFCLFVHVTHTCISH